MMHSFNATQIISDRLSGFKSLTQNCAYKLRVSVLAGKYFRPKYIQNNKKDSHCTLKLFFVPSANAELREVFKSCFKECICASEIKTNYHVCTNSNSSS